MSKGSAIRRTSDPKKYAAGLARIKRNAKRRVEKVYKIKLIDVCGFVTPIVRCTGKLHKYVRAAP